MPETGEKSPKNQIIRFTGIPKNRQDQKRQKYRTDDFQYENEITHEERQVSTSLLSLSIHQD